MSNLAYLHKAMWHQQEFCYTDTQTQTHTESNAQLGLYSEIALLTTYMNFVPNWNVNSWYLAPKWNVKQLGMVIAYIYSTSVVVGVTRTNITWTTAAFMNATGTILIYQGCSRKPNFNVRPKFFLKMLLQSLGGWWVNIEIGGNSVLSTELKLDCLTLSLAMTRIIYWVI